jgi:hypothetical protein
MSNMLKWAENELRLAGYNPNDEEDGPNKWLAEGTLELLKVFSPEFVFSPTEKFPNEVL